MNETAMDDAADYDAHPGGTIQSEPYLYNSIQSMDRVMHSAKVICCRRRRHHHHHHLEMDLSGVEGFVKERTAIAWRELLVTQSFVIPSSRGLQGYCAQGK